MEIKRYKVTYGKDGTLQMDDVCIVTVGDAGVGEVEATFYAHYEGYRILDIRYERSQTLIYEAG